MNGHDDYRYDALQRKEVLNEIFLEREPVEEVLLNNGVAFRSECMIGRTPVAISVMPTGSVKMGL